jgi:hypothetical protein
MATLFFRESGFAEEPYHSGNQQLMHLLVCLARRVRTDLTHWRCVLIFCENEGARILDAALTESAKLEQR